MGENPSHSSQSDDGSTSSTTPPIFKSKKERWKKEADGVAPRAEGEVGMKRESPKRFIEDTLLPHLEDQILRKSDSLPPGNLLELAKAYSNVPVRQNPLADLLFGHIKRRWDDFTPAMCVELLMPTWILIGPSDPEIYKMLSRTIGDNLADLTTTNLIGVLRVFAKLTKSMRPEPFFSREVVPRVWAGLEEMTPIELCDILGSISHQGGEGAEREMLELLLMQVVRKYEQTSLLHSTLNLGSLCRLKVYHKELLELLSNDLKDPFRIRGLPAQQLAHVVWMMSRFGKLDDSLLDTLTSLIEEKLGKCTVNEFARLSQALSEKSSVPERICLKIKDSVPTMSHRDFALFFLGCTRRKLFPCQEGTADTHEPHNAEESKNAASSNNDVAPSALASDGAQSELVVSVDKAALLHSCLAYIDSEKANMNEEEVARIIFLLLNSKEYRYLIPKMPSIWSELVEEMVTKQRKKGSWFQRMRRR
eukprot:Selendium_serpulae@DN3503_c0_g1_i1.p1